MDGSGSDRRDEIALAYTFLADAEFAGVCPPYERLARAAAGDAEVLACVAGYDGPARRLPVLVAAAVRYLGLGDEPRLDAALEDPGTDPWPTWREVLLRRRAEVGGLVATRAIQTNEVGRSAAVRSALAAVPRSPGEPLALLEVGTSAGLNLLPDRYRIEYRGEDGSEVVVGPAGSPVHITCRLRGPDRPPTDLGDAPIAARAGLDRRPIDVTSEDDRRWLQACLWPGMPDRARNLAAALDLARHEPPTVLTGAAPAALPHLLREAPAGAVPVLVATWVLGYLDREDRPRLVAAVGDLAVDRPRHLVTGEYPGTTPWVEVPRPPEVAEGTGATLLALHSWAAGDREPSVRPLAWIQAHGRWIDWVDTATAAPAADVDATVGGGGGAP